VLVAVLFLDQLNATQKAALQSFNSTEPINWAALKDPKTGIKLEVIAGAHRTWALQKLMRDFPDVDVYKTWPVRIIVCPSRDLTTLEILNDYGIKENEVSGLQLPMSHFAIVKNMRRSLELLGAIPPSIEVADGPVGRQKWGFHSEFKKNMLLRFKNSSVGTTVQSIDPLYQLARYPPEAWGLVTSSVKKMPSLAQQSLLINSMRSLQSIKFSVRFTILKDFLDSGSVNPNEFKLMAETTKKVKALQDKVVEVVNAFRQEHNIPMEEGHPMGAASMEDVNRLYPDTFKDSFFRSNVNTVIVKKGVEDAFTSSVRESLINFHKVIPHPTSSLGTLLCTHFPVQKEERERLLAAALADATTRDVPVGDLLFRFAKCDALTSMAPTLGRKAYSKPFLPRSDLKQTLSADKVSYRPPSLFLAIVEVDSPYTPERGNTDDRDVWYYEQWKKFFQQLTAIQLAKNFVIISFVDPLYSSSDFRRACAEAYENVEFDNFVWHRTNASNAGGARFTSAVECAILAFVGGHTAAASWNRAVFSSGSQARHNIVDLPEIPLNGKFRYPKDGVSETLNTMEKPVALYWFFLSTMCREKTNVLSVCSGSGSMAIASMIYGSSCDSVDINQRQHEGSIARFNKVKTDGAGGKWIDLIDRAATMLTALKTAKSWLAAHEVKEWLERCKEARKPVVEAIDNKNNDFKCFRCKTLLTTGLTTIVCDSSKCKNLLHNKCGSLKVGHLIVCSEACGRRVHKKVDGTDAEGSEEAKVEEDKNEAPAAAAAADSNINK
jgi:hypothetical protein